MAQISNAGIRKSIVTHRTSHVSVRRLRNGYSLATAGWLVASFSEYKRSINICPIFFPDVWVDSSYDYMLSLSVSAIVVP